MTKKHIPSKKDLDWLGSLIIGGPCNYALLINDLIKIGRTSNFFVRVAAHLRIYSGRTKTIFVLKQGSNTEMKNFELLLKQYCAPYLLKNFSWHSTSYEEFHPAALPIVRALMNERLTLEELQELKPISRKKYELRYLGVEHPGTMDCTWLNKFKVQKASLDDRMAIYQLIFFSDQKKFKRDPKAWMKYVIALLCQFKSIEIYLLCVLLIHIETRKYFGIEPYCANPRSLTNIFVMRLDSNGCSYGIKVLLQKTNARTVVKRIEMIMQKNFISHTEMITEVLCASAKLLQLEGLLTIYKRQ
jgi:hypothetical protein